MADYEQVKAEVRKIAGEVSANTREYGQLLSRVQRGESFSSLSTEINNLREKIQNNIASLQVLIDETIPAIDNSTVQRVNFQNRIANRELDQATELLSQLQNLEDRARLNENPQNAALVAQLNQNGGTVARNSAGDIVDNEQDARDNNANVQSPPQGRFTLDDQQNVVPAPQNINTGTNAREPNTQDDAPSLGNQTGGATSNVGGNTPVTPIQQSQRTNNGTPGASAPDDDQITPSQSSRGTSIGSGDRPAVAREFLEPIVSQPNILSGLSSMTYGLSLYLLAPQEFENFVLAENKVLPSNQLLIQSAGITTGERNPWFNVDFYIEDFTLESIVGTQAVGSAHNAVTLEFTVVEPQGITFLNRLNNAVIDHIGQQEKKTNAMAQTYLMLIRFYGYDAAGNPVKASDLELPATTDSNAIIEKFIPFMITNFSYKIASKATEYKIQGACHGTNLAFSSQRGAIPFNIQLTAGKIDQLFNGNLVMSASQSATPATNQAGSTQTVVSGLIQALNEQQQGLAGESDDIPDEYEIIFQDPDIQKASIIKPGNVSKSRSANQTAENAARKYLTSKLN